MSCDRFKEAMVEAAGGQVSLESKAHLDACEECRIEFDRIGAMWRKLGNWQEEEPRLAVRARFHEALEAYQQGLSQREHSRWVFWRPAFQIALSLGCLLIGVVGGQYLASKRSDVAELRQEMTSMRQLVTLSLLQQQSAAERLRGVTWANQTAPNDMEVLSALLRTVNTDTNENVRLAAVDALRNFRQSTVARRGIVQALGKQTSPLMQIAIIDLLTDLGEASAKPRFQEMLGKADLDPFVRTRIERSLALIP